MFSLNPIIKPYRHIQENAYKINGFFALLVILKLNLSIIFSKLKNKIKANVYDASIFNIYHIIY